MNVAEDTSIVSSMDNDSLAGSQDPLPDSGPARAGSLQDSQEGSAPGDTPNGSLPHSRKPLWNGAHGPYQEPHPPSSIHLLHQHPHLVSPICLEYLLLGEPLPYLQPTKTLSLRQIALLMMPKSIS